MHDGSLPTLLDVVSFYSDGGNQNLSLDPNIRPLRLTDEEKRIADLVPGVAIGNYSGWTLTMIVAEGQTRQRGRAIRKIPSAIMMTPAMTGYRVLSEFLQSNITGHHHAGSRHAGTA